MIGAIIGDMIFSDFEPGNGRMLLKGLGLFHDRCTISANSVMFLAVAKSLMDCRGKYSDLADRVRKNSQLLLESVLHKGIEEVSFSRDVCNLPVAYFARSFKEIRSLTFTIVPAFSGSTEDDAYAAEIDAASVFKHLRFKSSKEFKKAYIPKRHVFPDQTGKYLSEMDHAYFEAVSFESAIKNAMLTSDPANMAPVTCAMAEAYFGVPYSFRAKALEIIGPEQGKLFEDIENYTEPMVSTYIPDDTKPGKYHWETTRHAPSKWRLIKEWMIGGICNGKD